MQDAVEDRQPAAQVSPWRRWSRFVDVGLVGTLLCGTVWFLGWGVPSLRERQRAEPSPITSLRFPGRPAWFDAAIATPIARQVRDTIEAAGVNQESLDLTRTMLERTGWFDAVRQVALEDGAIRVDGRFATPCGLVLHGDREWLVGSRGQRMPLDFPVGLGPRVIRIRGVGEAPPELAGQVWSGERLSAALDVIALIESRPWFGEIAWIDVADAGQDDITLVTRGGTALRWGAPASVYQPGHVPPAQRVAALDAIVDACGSIDRAGFADLDLTLDVTLGRRRADGGIAAR